MSNTMDNIKQKIKKYYFNVFNVYSMNIARCPYIPRELLRLESSRGHLRVNFEQFLCTHFAPKIYADKFFSRKVVTII